ncbi:MAG: DUF2065 domain-containing protein [Gammaproteobacteria bacterium]
MWNELLSALCLVMVVEGLLPFLSPRTAKKMMALMAQMDSRSLRVSGLFSMLCGVLLLTLIN